MSDERQQELAALYALNLLEGAERASFEAALNRDPALQKLVSELRESAAAVALTAPAASPSPGLKSRVLTAIARSTAPVAEPAPASGKRLSFPSFLPWAAAAAFALGCAGLGQLYLVSRTEKALLRDQQTLAELELRSARQQLEAERILARRQIADAAAQLTERERRIAELDETSRGAERLRDQLAAAQVEIDHLSDRLRNEADLAKFKIATLASLAGNSPEALAVAVWNPTTQEGVLRVSRLPALASDQDYQLWVIDPAYPNPVDGGVFTVDPATGDARFTFHPNQPVTNATKFAVSRERKGGVPKAEGPILLLGD